MEKIVTIKYCHQKSGSSNKSLTKLNAKMVQYAKLLADQGSFIINEIPIKSVMIKVEHFERKQRGEKINKQYKEPTIVAGMPGSGP